MRMEDEVNGESQESVGGIRGQLEQQPPDERRAMQTRAFTRWMNVFLQKRDPPVEVHDLFTDIQDGRILLALLEELTGRKLLYRFRASPHRIFRLNNISKALAFLDDRHVKLLGIDASSVADGVPSVVLNLVWNIILYFQVKEVTGGLQRHLSSSLSSLSMSSYPSSGDLSPSPNDIGSYSCSTLPSKGRKAAREPKYHGKAIKTLLQWVQRCTSKFGVEVRDFGQSWRSGLAFLALIKSINPLLVDLRESLSREPRENIQLAFMIAHHSLDIPPLLEPEDVLCASPDEKSIVTYLSLFLGHCSGFDEGCTPDMEIPEIPNFGSLDSVHFGEILADEPEAKALLRGLEKSREQLLWKRWARRPSGGSRTSDLSSSCGDIFLSCRSQSISEQAAADSAATSPFIKKSSRCRSVLKPPSPLDAGVASPEIQSWMEIGSADQIYKKPRVGESHFSLSSEEGIYSLSTLDSDEEEAYSYILDLNKEVFQPCNQLKKQVPRVEEETVEEMLLNGQQTEESKHLDICEVLKGSGHKHLEGSLTQNVETEVRAPSAVHRKFDWGRNGDSFKERTNNGAVFGMQLEAGSRGREEGEEDTIVRGQSNDDGDYCEEEGTKGKTENAIFVTDDKTEAVVDETKKTKLFEATNWKKEHGEEIEQGLFEKCGQLGERGVVEKEEEVDNLTFEEGQDGELGKEKEFNIKEEDKESAEKFSFKVNERILFSKAAFEVREIGATRINTEEEKDKKVKAPRMEDLSCEEEDKGELDKVKNSVDVEAVRTEKEKESDNKIKRRKPTDKMRTTVAPKNDPNGGADVHIGDTGWTPACSAASESFRDGGSLPQSLAVFFGITPLELEMLLVLWILLYSCFILPQMNLL